MSLTTTHYLWNNYTKFHHQACSHCVIGLVMRCTQETQEKGLSKWQTHVSQNQNILYTIYFSGWFSFCLFVVWYCFHVGNNLTETNFQPGVICCHAGVNTFVKQYIREHVVCGNARSKYVFVRKGGSVVRIGGSIVSDKTVCLNGYAFRSHLVVFPYDLLSANVTHARVFKHTRASKAPYQRMRGNVPSAKYI